MAVYHSLAPPRKKTFLACSCGKGSLLHKTNESPMAIVFWVSEFNLSIQCDSKRCSVYRIVQERSIYYIAIKFICSLTIEDLNRNTSHRILLSIDPC